MEVSVVIPTYGRAAKVGACVAGLARQTLGAAGYEVLVGIDGGAGDAGAAGEVEARVREAWGCGEARLTVERCAKAGQASVRNELLKRARGRTLVFLNDDMLPEPDLLERHVAAQRERDGWGALVIGSAPWVVREPDSLFDRLIRETSMVFFYDRMDAQVGAGGVGRDHDWGFRHAWLLNLSAPARLVREAGGLTVFPSTYGYEDDELAFRCRERFGTPVLYRPEAVARHDHRLSPAEYLERERRLGFAAWGFARTAPGCALAMFGRDVTSEAEITYSREFVERERGAAQRVREVFVELANVPSDAAPGGEHPAGPPLMAALYQQHLLLKRWEWRRGLVGAAGGQVYS